MARLAFIKHQNRDILHVDLSGAHDDAPEGFEVLRELGEILARSEPDSVLAMADISEAYLSPKVFQTIKENAFKNRGAVRAAAIVGATGLKKLLMNVVTRTLAKNVQLVDTREQALAWLSTQ